MSPRSVYLRDQADKCRKHAENIGDADTQEQLRILAAEYIMSAVAIESEEPDYETRVRPPQMMDAIDATNRSAAAIRDAIEARPRNRQARPPRPRMRLS
jgi:hypothetical protein